MAKKRTRTALRRDRPQARGHERPQENVEAVVPLREPKPEAATVDHESERTAVIESGIVAPEVVTVEWDGVADGNGYGVLPPETVRAEAEELPERETGWGLTVEGVLWVVVGLAAAALRLGDLARWPLNEAEAALAVTALFETVPGVTGLSPLLLNLTDLFFGIFTPADFWARVVPALAGIGTVLAMLLFRPLVGRGTALGAALLIALSPTLLFFSRQAQPEALSALFSLLLVAGVARFAHSRQPRDAWLAIVALALGLASGPGFWSVLVGGAVFWGVHQWRARAVAEDEETDGIPARETPGSVWEELRPLSPRLLFGGTAIFLAAATGLGANPDALGGAFSLPVRWLGGIFGLGPSPVLPFVLVVTLYELPLLILGIAGAAMWADERPAWVTFLLAWVAVTLLPASLFGSSWLGGVTMVALPLALLGGAALARLAATAQEHGRWEVEGVYLALVGVIGGFLWLSILSYLQTADGQHMLLAAIALVVLLAALGIPWSAGGASAVGRTLGVTALILLPLVALRTAWMLSFTHGADPREPLVAAQIPSSPDLRTLEAILTDLSNERLRERDTLPIAVERSLGLAPRWYLRSFRQVSVVEGAGLSMEAVGPDGVRPVALLAGPDAPPPAGTIGSRFTIHPTWELPSMATQPLVRWLVTRDVSTGRSAKEAILYIRLPE